MRYPLLATFALGACKGAIEISAYEPSTLEIATVALEEDVEIEGNRRDFVGAVSVEGDGSDFVLTVDTSNGFEDIEVHTPGRSDLSLLDGGEGLRVSVQREPSSEELSLAVRDAAGDPLYLLEPVEPGLLSEELFGAGLVGRGEGLGLVQVDAWDLSLTSALLRTDAGDVELLPGEPQLVTISGRSFRAVLLASYEAELRIDGNLNCTGASERLAYELLRVDGEADLAPIVRPEGQSLPTSSCGAG